MESSQPPVPVRTRMHTRRRSLQGPSTPSSNRVHIQPASPEVISSLISSLSIISSPATQLFDHQSLPNTPATSSSAANGYFHSSHAHKSLPASGGSFGLDYGAYDSPSLRDLIVTEESLDELAASPPVIRTAKPPSGFSPLTSPKARDSSPLKFFRSSSRPTSRPSSVGSSGSKERDDTSSIGALSIEPGTSPVQDLHRKSSGDSWGKKSGRNSRGLMYMSSKERLREKEQERKRASTGGISSPGSTRPDRLVLQPLDSRGRNTDSFMAETPIGEEPEESQPKSSNALEDTSTGLSPVVGSVSQGGIGSGKFIPPRDSSLRHSTASAKRASHRSSRRSSKHIQKESDDVNSEYEGQQKSRESSRRRQKSASLEQAARMQEPLEDLNMSGPSGLNGIIPKSGRQTPIDPHMLSVEEADEGAPSPAISQRKVRPSPERTNSNRDQKRNSQKAESSDSGIKRSGSRLKRLSAPLSPKILEKDAHQRSNSHPAGRVTSHDPSGNPQIHIDDRPTSADSIDDAVEAYLCSPRLSQKIKHPQTGRTISFSEVGDADGFAVFCCVGMGLTRYITAFYDELALTLKLRLITPDRPGVGDSEPYTDGTATPLSWPDDVYSICQALKITKFSILAHSAGAIYALATALRMPQHIRGRIHLLAPWIPPSQMSVFGAQTVSPPANSLPTSQRILRALPTPMLKVANSKFMSATSSSITSSLPKKQGRNKRKSTGRETPAPSGRSTVTPGPEREHGRNSAIYPDPSDVSNIEKAAKDTTDPNHEAAVLAVAANALADKERQVTYDSRLTNAIWNLATEGANPAVDLLVCLERRHTIGFRYVDIVRPVVIHHGSKDTRVPVENVRWLGKTMKRCEVRVLEGEGHGLMASAVVMGNVLMDIAKEWEDWTKLTGASATGGKMDSARRGLRERASIGAFR